MIELVAADEGAGVTHMAALPIPAEPGVSCAHVGAGQAELPCRRQGARVRPRQQLRSSRSLVVIPLAEPSLRLVERPQDSTTLASNAAIARCTPAC
jgi:hypothetical protein